MYDREVGLQCEEQDAAATLVRVLMRRELFEYEDAYKAVLEFMERYNNRRIHRSIFNLSPVELHNATLCGSARSLVVTL